MIGDDSLSMRDRFVRGVSNEAGIRVLAVDATAAADEIRRRHGLHRHAARLAAEGLVAAQLMSAWIKGEERVTVQVQGERPRFAFIADVNADGTARARFTPGEVPDVEVFRGMILVIKHDRERELYRGAAPVEESTFEGALQSYLVRSQQSVGIVRVGAVLDADGHVGRAMGLLVEKLPDQAEDVFHDLFDGLATAGLGPVVDQVAQGVLWGFPVSLLETRLVRFHCPCSPERAEELVRALGLEEVRSLLAEQGRAELTCNFCQDRYVLERDQLQRIVDQLGG